jgi:hypothetical protein
MNNPNHIFWSLETIFGIFEVKILKFFDADPGSGMETVRIRDPGWKKVGSAIRDKHPGSATLPKVYDAVGEPYEVTIVFLHMSWQPDIDESQDIGQDHFLKGG